MKITKQDVPCLVLSVIVLVLALYSANAKAETNLFVGAWSTHLTGGDYNEQHDLIAVEHKNVIAGRFINSYSRETVFGAYKWAWNYKGLSAGVYGGLMHGYATCLGEDGSSKNVCPMVAPYVTWDAGPANPQVFLMGEAVAVSIRVGF